VSFRIVQITDSHLFADKGKVVGDDVLDEGINSFNTLASVLAKIPLYQPDLVLMTGDLSADESEQSYQHFSQLWRDAKIESSLMMIPGNHDDAGLMKACFPNWFWEDDVVEVVGWRLHCLHSQVPGQGRGKVNDEQLHQLQRDIRQHPQLHHFIAVHHHPIAMNSWMDQYNWTNNQDFVELVEKNPVIKVVVHGHVHTTRDIPIGQARLLAAPSTCWQFKHEPEFAFDINPPAFRVIDLNQDGTFDTSIIYTESLND
jgi:Icc protein